MATPTSLLLMASGDRTTAQEKSSMRTLFGFEEMKPEPNRNKSTRKSNGKGPNQKKQPQRGLGVAQLERLRIQERWKTMRETTPFQHESSPGGLMPLALSAGKQNQALQYQGDRHPTCNFTETNPLRGVSMQYGTYAQSHALSQMGTNGSTTGLLGLRNGGGCSTVLNGAGGGGSCYGFGGSGMLVRNQVNMVESYGIGALHSSKVLTGNAFETSKELSSMPNNCSSDSCNACSKKMRFNASDYDPKRSNKKTSSSLEMIVPPNHSSDFMSPHTAAYFNGEPSNFATREMRTAAASLTSTNLDENVEVVAIHRKGNSVGGSVFMEYEFFPDKIGRGTSTNEGELPAEGSVAVGCEASCITTSAYGDTSTNSIDLSLKLSL